MADVRNPAFEAFITHNDGSLSPQMRIMSAVLTGQQEIVEGLIESPEEPYIVHDWNYLAYVCLRFDVPAIFDLIRNRCRFYDEFHTALIVVCDPLTCEDKKRVLMAKHPHCHAQQLHYTDPLCSTKDESEIAHQLINKAIFHGISIHKLLSALDWTLHPAKHMADYLQQVAKIGYSCTQTSTQISPLLTIASLAQKPIVLDDPDDAFPNLDLTSDTKESGDLHTLSHEHHVDAKHSADIHEAMEHLHLDADSR